MGRQRRPRGRVSRRLGNARRCAAGRLPLRVDRMVRRHAVITRSELLTHSRVMQVSGLAASSVPEYVMSTRNKLSEPVIDDRNVLLERSCIVKRGAVANEAERELSGVHCERLSLVPTFGAIVDKVHCSKAAPHATFGPNLFTQCLHAFAGSCGTLDVFSSGCLHSLTILCRGTVGFMSVADACGVRCQSYCPESTRPCALEPIGADTDVALSSGSDCGSSENHATLGHLSSPCLDAFAQGHDDEGVAMQDASLEAWTALGRLGDLFCKEAFAVDLYAALKLPRVRTLRSRAIFP